MNDGERILGAGKPAPFSRREYLRKYLGRYLIKMRIKMLNGVKMGYGLRFL